MILLKQGNLKRVVSDAPKVVLCVKGFKLKEFSIIFFGYLGGVRSPKICASMEESGLSLTPDLPHSFHQQRIPDARTAQWGGVIFPRAWILGLPNLQQLSCQTGSRSRSPVPTSASRFRRSSVHRSGRQPYSRNGCPRRHSAFRLYLMTGTSCR